MKIFPRFRVLVRFLFLSVLPLSPLLAALKPGDFVASGPTSIKRIALSFDEPDAYARAFGEAIRPARPSMLLDLLAGRPSEIDVINGAIPPAAREVGLQAPVNATVSALVRAKSASA